MGDEYRLHIQPSAFELIAMCDALCIGAEWQRIPTSLTEVPGVGIQVAGTDPHAAWPHIVDLSQEANGTLYVVCHTRLGYEFVRALEDLLKRQGHDVVVEEL